MNFETLLHEIDGKVATITLDRPERRNAFSKRAIWTSLEVGLDEALANIGEMIRKHTQHPDLVEGPAAAVEKRAPRWAPDRND
jgi:enoyl-CoA hydratase/carnithine racemase